MRQWFQRREPTLSEEWAKTLPDGPLLQHLTALHHLIVYIGSTADEREVAEHSLRAIAVFTRTPPGPYSRFRPDKERP